jgi:hypothetical protein
MFCILFQEISSLRGLSVNFFFSELVQPVPDNLEVHFIML